MKNIVFVRHAKSSWEYDLPDWERPLKARGLKDANLVSKAFISNNFVPDKILSSSANRARTTCNIFMSNLSYSDKMLEVMDNLYDFSGHKVLEIINSIESKINNVMIFGHNYAFTSLVNSLGSRYIENLPTAGLVQIQFDTDCWTDLPVGKTVFTLFPRDLK